MYHLLQTTALHHTAYVSQCHLVKQHRHDQLHYFNFPATCPLAPSPVTAHHLGLSFTDPGQWEVFLKEGLC